MQSNNETFYENANYVTLEDNMSFVEKIQSTLNAFESDTPSTSYVKVLKRILSESLQQKEPTNTLSEKISTYLQDIPQQTTCCFISKDLPLKTKLQKDIKNSLRPARNKADSIEIKTIDYLKTKSDLAAAKIIIKELEEKLREAEAREVKLQTELETERERQSQTETPKDTTSPLNDEKQTTDSLISQITIIEESLNDTKREVRRLKLELASEREKNKRLIQSLAIAGVKDSGLSSLSNSSPTCLKNTI